jgi:uncharacterized membrane protein YedE/YeeE
MSIAWDQFTPWASLIGGVLIGLATALYILGSGRIAGISGIVGGALQSVFARRPAGRDAARWAFIVGLLAAPWLWRLVAPMPAASSDASTLTLLAAGLLVGFGTRMGSGCTSGHGVCGLSRLSLRSLVNVLAFMGAGVAAVFVVRHL